MRKNIHRTIKKTIMQMCEGDVITLSDFDTIASPKTVSKTLERMTKSGVIEKLFSGIYWIPSISSPLSALNVARAFARKNRWSIAPAGNTALHILGLSRKTPEEWTFVTNDKNVEYQIKNLCITFKHTSDKFLEGMSDNTKLLVQAIKAYGKEGSTESLKEYFSRFQFSELEKMVRESSNVTKWIFEKISNLVYGEGGKAQ